MVTAYARLNVLPSQDRPTAKKHPTPPSSLAEAEKAWFRLSDTALQQAGESTDCPQMGHTAEAVDR